MAKVPRISQKGQVDMLFVSRRREGWRMSSAFPLRKPIRGSLRFLLWLSRPIERARPGKELQNGFRSPAFGFATGGEGKGEEQRQQTADNEG